MGYSKSPEIFLTEPAPLESSPGDKRETDWPVDLFLLFQKWLEHLPFSSLIILFLKSQNQSNLWKNQHIIQDLESGEKLSWYSGIKNFLLAQKNSGLLSIPFLILYLLFLTVTALKYSYNYLCSPKDAFCCFNRLLWFHLWKFDWFWSVLCFTLIFTDFCLSLVAQVFDCVKLLQSSQLVFICTG